MAKHISSHFNQELESVRSEVMQMGGLVEQQLERVQQSLNQGSVGFLADVIEADRIINDFEVQIDDHCQTIIARRQPAAGDLRFVLAVSRVIVDLERIGDELKKIAQYLHDLLQNNRISTTGLYDTHRLIEMTVQMLRRALDAFARLDETAVLEIAEADHKLDTDYRNQARILISYMIEDPRSISTWIDVMMINKAIERIGDHAKNVAEHVVYLVRGVDIRHKQLDQLKQDLA
ncbi:phosphate transport system regulatory protein PhoU [Pasteurellaceae bacterium RH1A]|nr:phosphate transport system regulatory protein PhoU [Pasteurellaceae bacterium RH1A]